MYNSLMAKLSWKGLALATRGVIAVVAVVCFILIVLQALLWPVGRHRVPDQAFCEFALRSIRNSVPPSTADLSQAFEDRSNERGVVASWRVLLLPYFDRPTMFSRFNQREAWDSVSNLAFLKREGNPYTCPVQRRKHKVDDSTHYIAVNRPGGLVVDIAEMDRQGTSASVVLVEDCRSQIAWTEPRDIPARFKTSGAQFEGCNHGGMAVLFADGRVSFVSSKAVRWSSSNQ